MATTIASIVLVVLPVLIVGAVVRVAIRNDAGYSDIVARYHGRED